MNIARVVSGAAILAGLSCGKTPTGPTASEPLPFVSESSSMRYYHEPGDSVDVAWQEIYNGWALERLGMTVRRKSNTGSTDRVPTWAATPDMRPPTASAEFRIRRSAIAWPDRSCST